MTMLRETAAHNDNLIQEPGDADYIYGKIENSFRSGDLTPLVQALEELQRDHQRETGYPQGNEFFDRASKALLSDQIRRAEEAAALRTDPELAAGELLLRNEGVRRFMAEAPRFRQEAEHVFMSVRMDERSLLPLSPAQAEDLFLEIAGEPLPPETGEPPHTSYEAALSIGRHARETFLKILRDFPNEDHRDLSRFAKMNLAVAAAAAHIARMTRPDNAVPGFPTIILDLE